MPTVCMVIFGMVGLKDDYKKLVLKDPEGMSASKKMLGLFIASAIFLGLQIVLKHIAPELIIPFFMQPLVIPMIAFVLFNIVVLLSITNAINFTDGLDGLASGVSVIILTFLTLSAMRSGNVEVALFGAIVIGSTIGFLMFNLKPAKVFMGDTGSLALGAAIGMMAILLKMPIYLLIAAIIPVIEVVSVIIQVVFFKITKGKRFFKMAPIHHHFEMSGWSENVIVFIFWVITALACLGAYLI
ncbi:MAG: phospho-N-acetylmuramoyl-pentapeptide-transferase [Clostridia bacterium]